MLGSLAGELESREALDLIPLCQRVSAMHRLFSRVTFSSTEQPLYRKDEFRNGSRLSTFV